MSFQFFKSAKQYHQNGHRSRKAGRLKRLTGGDNLGECGLDQSLLAERGTLEDPNLFIKRVNALLLA